MLPIQFILIPQHLSGHWKPIDTLTFSVYVERMSSATPGIEHLIGFLQRQHGFQRREFTIPIQSQHTSTDSINSRKVHMRGRFPEYLKYSHYGTNN
jgi:hypothetical protein